MKGFHKDGGEDGEYGCESCVIFILSNQYTKAIYARNKNDNDDKRIGKERKFKASYERQYGQRLMY